MRAFALPLLLGLAAACGGGGALHPELSATARHADALAVYDALEALIDEGKASPRDRAYAYDQVRAHEEDTAAYALARAAVAGRLAQERGLAGAPLVAEVERYARRSRELDPAFRDGAATRLLGTLYVLAPGALLEHGDSEAGLALLEELTRAHPEVLENHLRLAEALIALGDAEPAIPHLCACAAKRSALRGDSARLLDRLQKDAGSPACAPASAPPSGAGAAASTP